MKIMALTDDAVLEAADMLRAGGTVVYPTETAYALGADPLNPAAVQAVFHLKGRNDNKPMGLIAASAEQVDALCTVSDAERALMKHWPGALSIVLQLRQHEGSEAQGLDLTTAGSGTASVRVSSNPHARRLAEILGHPVIATSANQSGQANIFSFEALRQAFPEGRQPDLILDGGTLQEGPMSTVVRVENGAPVILRKGAVTL